MKNEKPRERRPRSRATQFLNLPRQRSPALGRELSTLARACMVALASSQSQKKAEPLGLRLESIVRESERLISSDRRHHHRRRRNRRRRRRCDHHDRRRRSHDVRRRSHRDRRRRSHQKDALPSDEPH